MLRVLKIVITILLVYGGTASGQAREAVPPRRHVVEIRDFGFHPRHVLASPGDTIVWINRDIVPHTATANNGSWTSGELAEGESWEMVVKNTTSQNYFCEFHPHMEGVLEAREGFDWSARGE